MTNRGLLIVISGPSGVGKDTILDKFMPGADICVRSVSATTRPPRQGEEQGRDYYFLTRREFEDLTARGEMLESTEYNGNYYGTPLKNVQKLLSEGKNVILKIEVNGGLEVKRLYPEAVLVFIVAPSLAVLERRLRRRGTETEEAINARLRTARYEISKAEEYDYIIINDALESCAERLRAVVTAAGCTKCHMAEFIKEAYADA